MAYRGRVEYAHQRKIRERNTRIYRLAHWPIWIWVFFLAPGPLTFSLFAKGFHGPNFIWLLVVMACTGIAGYNGQLPGVEPRPYILRFDEDKPNPLYRRVCYTFAWNALLSFAIMNLAGLVIAVATGMWILKQIYQFAYFPVCLLILLLGVMGVWPRVGRSTQREGTERRYFYGAVWSITGAQTVLLILWQTLPKTHVTDIIKLAVFLATLLIFGFAAFRGTLPRTRPIVAGEWIVAD
jgi:hypothetical protein